jgi:methylphosphotriester-DNA--protein-cysteine methyltransferase
MLDDFLDIMMYFSQLKKYGHRQEFLFGMLRCMTIGVFATIKRQSNNEHNTAYTSADGHFRNFIKLLADESRHQHDVGYYAERLHITPKYLNEITNKKANATAKTVISSFLIAQIKRELTFTNTPIQKSPMISISATNQVSESFSKRLQAFHQSIIASTKLKNKKRKRHTAKNFKINNEK